MPAVTRKGDKSTGHDLCLPAEAVSGESSFLVNGKPVVTVGDIYAPHGCEKHTVHQGRLAGGSSVFLVNGKAVGRVGDPISCGGTVAEGSDNFIIGNGNEQKRNKALCKRNEAVTRYTRSRDDDIFYCLPLIAEAVGNRKDEQDRQGWHYLRDMFYKWLAGEANAVPQNNPSPFWVDIDWVLSYDSMKILFYNEIKFASINSYAKESLEKILKREGYFINQNITFDFTKYSWQEWEKYYYQHYSVKLNNLIFDSGLLACFASFTFRLLPKGKIEYLGEKQYKIILEEVFVFVHDIFNFDENGNEWGLGYWNCKEKDVRLLYGSEKNGYIYMNNEKFNSFRKQNNIGNDFLVFSETKKLENFIPYNWGYSNE